MVSILDAKKKSSRIVLAGSLILVLLVFAVFGRSLGHGFANYDDRDCTFGNPAISKGISAGFGQNTYRGLVKILPKAENARNYGKDRGT